jgi:hypothetical protein
MSTTKTRKKRKKRTKKRTSGSSFVPGRLLIAIAFLVTLLCPAALSEKKEKQKAAAAPFALIAGTVFRPPGFALPGAEVVIAPEQREVNGVKLKKAEAVTNFRGEFAVRVPPVPAKWRVDVKSSGYRPEQRSVSVEGEQRLDLSIVLEPVHPPKEAQ